MLGNQRCDLLEVDRAVLWASGSPEVNGMAGQWPLAVGWRWGVARLAFRFFARVRMTPSLLPSILPSNVTDR
jgi:hypothetical protein